MTIFRASDINKSLTDTLRKKVNEKMLDCFNNGNGSFVITSRGGVMHGLKDYEQFNTNLSGGLLRELAEELKQGGYSVEECTYKFLKLEVEV